MTTHACCELQQTTQQPADTPEVQPLLSPLLSMIAHHAPVAFGGLGRAAIAWRPAFATAPPIFLIEQSLRL